MTISEIRVSKAHSTETETQNIVLTWTEHGSQQRRFMRDFLCSFAVQPTSKLRHFVRLCQIWQSSHMSLLNVSRTVCQTLITITDLLQWITSCLLLLTLTAWECRPLLKHLEAGVITISMFQRTLKFLLSFLQLHADIHKSDYLGLLVQIPNGNLSRSMHEIIFNSAHA